MLPHHLTEPFVAAGDLWQLPPYEDLPPQDVFVITNPAAMLNPAEQAFLAHMQGMEPLIH